MDKRQFKDEAYTHLSVLGHAFGNARRMEILDLLANGEKSVDNIARETGLSLANASQHLQVLKAAGVVRRRRQGTYILYCLAGPEVFSVWLSLRGLSRTLSSGLDQTLQTFRADPVSTLGIGDFDPEGMLLIDVRPAEEFSSGHISSALSIPLEELQERMNTLPKNKHLVAYCRGPFCVFADEAIRLLRENGFIASRLEEGYAEWALTN